MSSFTARARISFCVNGNRSGELYVFNGRESRKQVKCLEDKTQLSQSNICQRVPALLKSISVPNRDNFLGWVRPRFKSVDICLHHWHPVYQTRAFRFSKTHSYRLCRSTLESDLPKRPGSLYDFFKPDTLITGTCCL